MKDPINMAWNKNTRQAFIDEHSSYRIENFDFDKMERFYNEKDLSAFDEDVRRFFAFLAGDGYFEENKITFEKWITIKNCINPSKDIVLDLSIKEALDYKGGMNYIRMVLRGLHWWRQKE